MMHFCPISCYNVIYKWISKLLVSRLKYILPTIISPFQSAFVPKRLIGDNMFVAQALCKDYHLEVGPPRCAIKLDISKAFDTLNWGFLFSVMRRMGFPSRFIDWVRVCITSGMFSIKLNGSLEGYFSGKAGLRQGDPLSPYLFVLDMEVLTSYLNKAIVSVGFRYQ